MRKEVKVFIIFPCVQTFFQLVSGELAWWCSRNLGFNMKLPASYWVGALVPAEELCSLDLMADLGLRTFSGLWLRLISLAAPALSLEYKLWPVLVWQMSRVAKLKG